MTSPDDTTGGTPRDAGPTPGAGPAPGPDAAGAPPPDAAASATTAGDDVAALRATIASLEDRLRRTQAEFVNDLRRVQRQADERVRYAAQPVVEDVLGVADALHRAVEGLKDSEHERRVAEGLHMVERQLIDGLARHGVARIDAAGKPFDPALHEAILEVESPAAARTVLQVVRPGFTLHGRLVRAAHVIVSKPAAPPAAPDTKG
ncbi:MAG: nucleotide exchange factor GrpE [Planctomycetia bacterium]|nr:nucleotide exchange factor GrpE [Planctomycetia bacterium]